MAKAEPAKKIRPIGQIPLIAAIAKHVDPTSKRLLNARQLNAIIKAADLIVAELNKPDRQTVPGEGLEAWLASDSTGDSSLTMACRLCHRTNIVPFHRVRFPDFEKSHPRDPADFGRCLGLLAAVPEFAPLVSMMSPVSPEWAALVDRWSEVEALYREESPSGRAPRTYELMRSIFDSIKGEANP